MESFIKIQSLIPQISDKFKSEVNSIFGTNLKFAFIFGGFAKEYAHNFDHDIDIFVCLESRNSKQEEAFRKFYFNLHEDYGFTPDYTDPVEITTYEELKHSLDMLENLEIRLTIEGYQEYESIVWGDIFAGKTIAEAGDIELLEATKLAYIQYPEKWRRDILKQLKEMPFNIKKIKQLEYILSNFEKRQLSPLNDDERKQLDETVLSFKTTTEEQPELEKTVLSAEIIDKLEKLNITLLFEVFVTYLKIKDTTPSSHIEQCSGKLELTKHQLSMDN